VRDERDCLQVGKKYVVRGDGCMPAHLDLFRNSSLTSKTIIAQRLRF
jgi:hypothetical protein